MIVKNLSGKGQTLIPKGIILILSFFLILISANKFNFFIEISDGLTYNQLFERLESVDLISGYLIYLGVAGEPFTYLLFYLFAQISSFLVFNNVLNVFLLFGIFYLFFVNRVNLLVSILLIISNYYILILQYGAIRLKIAVIILIFSEISKNRKRIKLYQFLAGLAHFQISIMIFIDYLYKYFKDKNVKIDKKIFLYGGVIIFTFYSYLSVKINYYFNVNGILFPYKVTLFFLLSIVTLNKLKFASISFLVLFSLALFIGEGRIVLMYYFLIVIHFVKDRNKGILKTIFIILISLYFSFKGFSFANSLFNNFDYFLDDSFKF